MKKSSSASKGAAANDGVIKGGSIDWELRPGGMLVQKRQPLDSSSSSMIKIKVSHGSYHHEVTVPAQSTFGKLIIIHYAGTFKFWGGVNCFLIYLLGFLYEKVTFITIYIASFEFIKSLL